MRSPTFPLAVCAAAVLICGAPRAAAQGRPFIEASGEFSPVTIGDASTSWHLGRLSAGWFDEGRGGFTAGGERHQRGRSVDVAAVATGFRRSGDWTIAGSAGVTVGPEFLYRYSLEGEIARRVAGPVVLHGGYRHLAFRFGHVQLAQPAASVYFPRGDVQGRLFLVRNAALGRKSAALLVRGTFAIHARLRLGGGAALGDRIFDVASLAGSDASGWVAFGYARVTLDPAWSVDVGVGRAHEDPFFSQRTVTLALRRTFR